MTEKKLIQHEFDKFSQDSRVITDEWGVNAVDNSAGTVLYVGRENSSGSWWIMKIDSTGGFPVLTHATAKNNSYTDYSTAWTNRLTASYGNYSVAF